MKILSVLITFISLVIFANTIENVNADYVKQEVAKALTDFNSQVQDENGSSVYQLTLNELNNGSLKTHHEPPPPPPPHHHHDDYDHHHHHEYDHHDDGDDALAELIVDLFASSLSLLSEAIENDTTSCIQRGVSLDNVSYETCKSDCKSDPRTH